MVRYQRPLRPQKTFEFMDDTQPSLPPETRERVVQLAAQLLREIVAFENSPLQRRHNDEREN